MKEFDPNLSMFMHLFSLGLALSFQLFKALGMEKWVDLNPEESNELEVEGIRIYSYWVLIKPEFY